MFRPNVAIIRFISESMVVLLYRIGMDMSRWWDLSICDVCYKLFLRGMGGGWGICDVRYPGGAAQVCLLAAVLCGSAATVCPYPMSTAGGLLLWVLWRGEKPKNKSWCGLVFVWVGDLCDVLWLSGKLRCVLTCVLSILCICGWKPDDCHIRPKHVVYFILY